MTATQDIDTTIAHIGMGNVLAISGGRIQIDAEGRMILPVRYGYAVQVSLAENDTYTVARTFTRSGVTTVRATRTNVYADQVGEIAYRASCFRDEF